ncbi:MAG: hypothetical protein MJ187_04675 [Alphaproteobacteria bacterium]|nr:hypothetical protein [Alphaproteobacteria bacterium]
MIKIFKNTKFYVACPASFQTGGTEALHVLAFELRKMGINAIMYYREIKDNKDVIGERFKCFNIPYVFDIEDEQDNVLIVPEIWGGLLKKYKQVQKVFWWLSVDNYLVKTNKHSFFSKNKISFKDKNILHLAQSQYALCFLEKHKVKNKSFLGDYLREDFFEKRPVLKSSCRKDIILFNPAKGYGLTKKIILSAPDLIFMPLKDMTPTQVRDLCLQSKIYIDFGNHPGKDRFPREAAIQGNIVIVGLRGSAVFYEDVPIKSEYKFKATEDSVKNIVLKIRDCIKNYDTKITDFEYYRSVIEKDHEKFISDLKSIIDFVRQ